MNISFKGHYICDSQVKRNNKPCALSFVQIDTKNKSDIAALKELDYMYERKSYFGDISDNASLDYRCNISFNDKKYYVLTSQKRDFEKLDSDMILGAVQVEPHENCNEINYLQVIPEQNYFNPEREYKNLGSSIVNTIMKLFPEKKLMLYSSNSAINFYKKLGFTQDKSETRFNKFFFDKNM